MTASPETMTAIYNGISNLDRDQIDLVIDALRDQQDILRRRAHRETLTQLKIGSRVEVGPNIKPKYLAGLRGEVLSLTDGKVKIKLDRGPTRKFASGTVTFRSAAAVNILVGE